jgi:hypothetical protein
VTNFVKGVNPIFQRIFFSQYYISTGNLELLILKIVTKETRAVATEILAMGEE